MRLDDHKQMQPSPLHQIIPGEAFERLLGAGTMPNTHGSETERVAACHRATLWVFSDTGIRASEPCNLRSGDMDRHQGVMTLHGNEDKQRRIALRHNCLRHLLFSLGTHRPNEQEGAQWGHPGEDHVLLSEKGQPLTKTGLTILLTRLKERAGSAGKCLYPSTFRRTFALRSLELSYDLFSLQKVLGSLKTWRSSRALSRAVKRSLGT